MKKYLILIICLILLSGCSKENNSIIGKWSYYSNNKTNDEIYYEFNEDKTGVYSFINDSIEFKYEVNENKITIKYNLEELENTDDSFSDKVTYKRNEKK